MSRDRIAAAGLAMMLAGVLGCGLLPNKVPKSPADVATVASSARKASVEACKVYRAARLSGLVPEDDAAEVACAAVVGVCDADAGAP